MGEWHTYARFEDGDALVAATKRLREEGVIVADAYSPFPIHGLDEVLGIRRSRLPIVCFIAASVGCLGSFYFQYWTSAIDWPINVGGKPFNSVPAFIPVAFEITVLLGGLTTVAGFFFRSRLFPGKLARMPHPSVTNDGFWLSLLCQTAKRDANSLEALVKELGGQDILSEEVP